MTLLGKPLSEYVAFTKGLTVLILVVGITRLALSLGGVPNSTTRWLAMSGVMFFGTIYLAVRVHTAGFGSYKELFPAILIPNATLHLVSILGVVIGMITGQDNVFTAPEFSLGGDGKTLIHVGAHLVIGIPFSTLVNWIVGCLFFVHYKENCQEACMMHSTVRIGPHLIMASDATPGMPVQTGDNFHVCIHCDSAEEIDRLFAALGENGQVPMPLQDTFWGARFGTLKDQFGIHWMFNFEIPEKG